MLARALVYCMIGLAAFAAALPHKEIMDADGKFVLEWEVDETNTFIEIAARVQTTGWMAIGVSPNGGMPGSDIVMAWIDEQGNKHFTDRYADSQSEPSIDSDQSGVELLELSSADGALTLRYRRALAACDSRDRTIEGTSRVLYAWNDAPLADCDSRPMQHPATQRGSRSIRLDQLEAESHPNEIDGAENIESIVLGFDNVETVGGRTRYYWKAGRLPFDETVHVVGVEPLIPDVELTQAHHLLLYVCPGDLSDEQIALVGDKHDPLVRSLEVCNFIEPILAWAVGGKPTYFDRAFGIPVGGAGRSSFMMEAHLDVVDEKPHVTNMKFRVLYTRKLRPNDGGIMVVGANVDEFLLTPAGTKTDRIGYCHSACSERGLPAGGINIVGSMLHMHTIGVGMKTQLVRANGTEMPLIDDDQHYDFNLQTYEAIEPVQMYPGDQLITTCTYDGTGRAERTLGGEGTDAEMCLHYLMVWPKPTISGCLSTGSRPLVGALLQTAAFNGTTPGESESLYGFFSRAPLNGEVFNTAMTTAYASSANLFTSVCIAFSGNFLLPFNASNIHAAVHPTVPYVPADECGDYVAQPDSAAVGVAACVNPTEASSTSAVATATATASASAVASDVDSAAEPETDSVGMATEPAVEDESAAGALALGAAALVLAAHL